MHITELQPGSHILEYLEDKGLDYLEEYELAAIAGASVASLILKDDNLPINDVDVFIVDELHGKYDRIESKRHDYELMAGAESTKTYKILGVETDGILNIISCFSTFDSFAEDLIKSFDFNCVACAVVKRSDKFYLLETDEFVKFKQTKVVEVINIHTPQNTLTRYYKKQKELPYKFDQLSLKRLQFMCSVPHYGSEITKEKFEKYVPEDERAKFTITKAENTEFYMFTRENEYNLNPNEMKCDLLVLSKVYVYGNKATKERYSKFNTHLNILKVFCDYGVESIQQDFSTKNLNKFNEYLTLVPTLHKLLTSVNTMNGLFQHLESVRQLANTHTIVRENLSMYLAHSANGGDLKSFLINMGLDVRLAEPLDLSDLKLENEKVEQLITSGRLKAEGDSMHHCVGGYSNKVKDGHSFIFRLTIDDKSSTLELNSKYQIVQNRGVSNSQPAFKLDDLAKKLARFLIDKALDGSSEVYSERVMEF